MSQFTIKADTANYEEILTPAALAFVESIAERFTDRRNALMSARCEAQERFDCGELPGFLSGTADIRHDDWQVADAPTVLQDRRVEITAPAERKKIILALNSSAKVCMIDFEDSLAPTWDNLLSGQQALKDAMRGDCRLTNAKTGKEYALNPQHTCELIVRPRGWHLPETNIRYKGAPLVGAFLDFGLFFFHNAKILAEKGRGPFFYLPKTEHWAEAALWNDIMDFAEQQLGVVKNTSKVTLLIETLPAVFQMHEILHAMKNRLIGLNCGRWDYIFSYIKTLRAHGDRVLPERNQVTMTQPLLRAYSLELIKTCHRRNAHAMGGMAAFIPIKNNPIDNRAAMQKVYDDKYNEAMNGHDGTWVAHPDLISIAKGVFDEIMPAANQKNKLPDVVHNEENFLAVPLGDVSIMGFQNNIQVGLRYIAAWLGGTGAVPIFNMMEDMATAEISRSQLWQWLHYPTWLSDNGEVTSDYFTQQMRVIVEGIKRENGIVAENLDTAADILTDMVHAPQLDEFLPLKVAG